MVNRYIKSYSRSLVNREMQIKITMKYQLILVRMAFIKERRINRCWGRCGDKWTLCTVSGNVYKTQSVQAVWKTGRRFLRKFK